MSIWAPKETHKTIVTVHDLTTTPVNELLDGGKVWLSLWTLNNTINTTDITEAGDKDVNMRLNLQNCFNRVLRYTRRNRNIMGLLVWWISVPNQIRSTI